MDGRGSCLKGGPKLGRGEGEEGSGEDCGRDGAGRKGGSEGVERRRTCRQSICGRGRYFAGRG